MSTPVEEIKQRLDIVDLIQEYIKLTPAGSNFKTKCPFHNEKTPSMMVSPEKQIWHCFGCGAGGDHFEFVKKLEGIEFPEALRILAKRANVKLEYQDPELHNQKTRLLDLVRDLTEHWHKILLEDPKAQSIREYLDKRGVKTETIKTFQLGYALDSWEEAVSFLLSKKYSLREIEQAGVSKVGEKNRPYDRFRNRLIFPIRDIHGNVAGFTGRIMAKEFEGGKYINSPASQIYNKSNILYNLDLAKQEVKKQDYAILVEGNMDALAAYQAGTKNAVAVSGTSLTNEQIKLLKRFTQNVMIAFDADLAGTAANLRGIDLAWQAGFNVKVVHLPSGKDPDDLIKEDVGKWKEALKSADNFMDYTFEVILKELDLSKVEHKKKAAKKLLPVIAKLGDNVEQSHYIKKLSEVLEVTEEALNKALGKIEDKTRITQKEGETQSTKTPVSQEQIVAERLLALLVEFPDYLEEVLKRLEPEEIIYLPIQELYKEMIIYYNKENNLELEKFSSTLTKSSQDYLNRLSLLVDKDFFQDNEKDIQNEISQTIERLKRIYLSGKLHQVERDLRKAEEQKDQDKINLLSEEFSKFTSRLQEL